MKQKREDRTERQPAWAQAFRVYWEQVRAGMPSEDANRSTHKAAFRQGWIRSGLERARRVRAMRAKGTKRTREQRRDAALRGRQ